MEEKNQTEESRVGIISEHQEYFCRDEEVSKNQMKTIVKVWPEIKLRTKILIKKKNLPVASKIELIADAPNFDNDGTLKIITNEQDSYLIDNYRDIRILKSDYEIFKKNIKKAYYKGKPLKIFYLKEISDKVKSDSGGGGNGGGN